MPAKDTTETPPLPEILRSRQLAAILTPMIMDMVRETAIRYDAAHLGRVMAAPLAAIRATVNEIRRAHGMGPLDETGEPLVHLDGDEYRTAPEPAEAVS